MFGRLALPLLQATGSKAGTADRPNPGLPRTPPDHVRRTGITGFLSKWLLKPAIQSARIKQCVAPADVAHSLIQNGNATLTLDERAGMQHVWYSSAGAWRDFQSSSSFIAPGLDQLPWPAWMQLDSFPTCYCTRSTMMLLRGGGHLHRLHLLASLRLSFPATHTSLTIHYHCSCQQYLYLWIYTYNSSYP